MWLLNNACTLDKILVSTSVEYKSKPFSSIKSSAVINCLIATLLHSISIETFSSFRKQFFYFVMRHIIARINFFFGFDKFFFIGVKKGFNITFATPDGF